MADPDFSGIEPMRRAEVRRRVRLVAAYLDGPRTAKRREAAADELGISPGQFLRLARIWRETETPARLYGAGRREGARRRGLAPAAQAAVDGAIDLLGHEAQFSDVMREIVRRCGETGASPPAASTVYNRMSRRRAAAGPLGGEPSITLVPCAIRLPVTRHGAIVRPVALLAVVMPEGLVAAAEIGLDGIRDPDVGRLLRRLDRRSRAQAPVRPVIAPSTLTGGLAEKVIDGVPIRQRKGISDLVSRVFGQRLGTMRITSTSHSDRRYEELAATRLNRTPTIVEATAMLIDAVQAHNASRWAGDPPSFSLSGRERSASISD